MKQWMQLLVILLIGFLLWQLPYPEGSDPRGGHLLAIFIATIVGIVMRPLPMGAIALIAMGITVASQTLSLHQMLEGFANEQIWLIVIACFIARGFIKTGLGQRIAYLFLFFFGRSPLGLAYGFLASDLLMAPAIPSSTARAGGVLLPILSSLSQSLGSHPASDSSRKIGAFLSLSTFHATIITTTMFLTASAANPIIAKFVLAHSGLEMTWGLWAKAALLPALICLAAIPLILYKLYPPKLTETAHASKHAKEKLHEMGKITSQEMIMLLTFVFLLILWIFGQELSLHATTTALLGLAFLLLTNVLSWKEVLGEEVAWDSFIWFATLITMASHLNSLGVIKHLSDAIVLYAEGWPWHYALLLLLVVYFYLHYFFASVTAHVSSLYVPFLSAALIVKTPPSLAAILLAYCSTLCGGLTHYSIGQAPILYSMRYVELKHWWAFGALLCFFYLLVWSTIGPLWWRWLGLW